MIVTNRFIYATLTDIPKDSPPKLSNSLQLNLIFLFKKSYDSNIYTNIHSYFHIHQLIK